MQGRKVVIQVLDSNNAMLHYRVTTLKSVTHPSVKRANNFIMKRLERLYPDFKEISIKKFEPLKHFSNSGRLV